MHHDGDLVLWYYGSIGTKKSERPKGGKTAYTVKKLDYMLGIIVPTKDRKDNRLPDQKVRSWESRLTRLFKRWFGADTEGVIFRLPRQGDFDVGSGEFTYEANLHIWAHCTRAVFLRRRADVVRLAKEMYEDLNQASVGHYENWRFRLVSRNPGRRPSPLTASLIRWKGIEHDINAYFAGQREEDQ